MEIRYPPSRRGQVSLSSLDSRSLFSTVGDSSCLYCVIGQVDDSVSWRIFNLDKCIVDRLPGDVRVLPRKGYVQVTE